MKLGTRISWDGKSWEVIELTDWGCLCKSLEPGDELYVGFNQLDFGPRPDNAHPVIVGPK